jgi:hypothetical protein
MSHQGHTLVNMQVPVKRKNAVCLRMHRCPSGAGR